MNSTIWIFFVFSLSLISAAVYGDEFDDTFSNAVHGEDSLLEVERKNEIESATVVPEQDNKTNVDPEKPTEADQQGFTQSPETDEDGEGVEEKTEKATWQINQYMPGCDHDVRDCYDAAIKLNNPEGVAKDAFLFDCMEAHDCMPLKRWACDSNINFINRHTLLTEKCLKWGLYQYQEQAEQEVDREL